MDVPSRYSRFLPHATFSRLRSFVPQPEDKPVLLIATAFELSGSPRDSASSPIGLMNSTDEHVKRRLFHEAFRWSSLKDLGQHIFVKKAATMLGSSFGEPTVLAVNGRICIGTDRGYALVFNLKQELVCICKGGISCESLAVMKTTNFHTSCSCCNRPRYCCRIIPRSYLCCCRLR